MDRHRSKYFTASIALLTAALLVASCSSASVTTKSFDPQTTPSKTSTNLTSMESEDGIRKYRFETPLFEEYDQAKEPYIELKKGVKVAKFAADSTTIEADLVANYARYDKKKKIWEARGNVIAHSYKEDRTLYTEQLFWDEGRKKIYTDKPAKMVDAGKIHYGTGFESDEKFEVWQFNRARGQIEIQDKKDSTAQSNPPTTNTPTSTPAPTPGT